MSIGLCELNLLSRVGMSKIVFQNFLFIFFIFRFAAGEVLLTSLPAKEKSKTFRNIIDWWNQDLKISNFKDSLKPVVYVAPCSSQNLDLFVKSDFFKTTITRKSQIFPTINCVTAMEKYDSLFPQVAAFPSGRQYLDTVFDRIKNKLSFLPKRIVFIYEPSVIYLEEGRPFIQKEIEIKFKKTQLLKIELKDLKKIRFNSTDWVVFWVSRPQEYLRLPETSGFKQALKILIYGKDNPEWLNSIQVLFWSPLVAFEKSKSNCIFVKKYSEKFNKNVDFHGAYLWSTLQLAFKANPNILGSFNLNKNGRIDNYVPILVYKNKVGKLMWDLGHDQRFFCDSSVGSKTQLL